ncbi:olfactory receptor 5B12-like [Aquarana catesbeiana]|uniref:olfactory receptor 5B12-like n=1 Tax=Aquarana catesbeiana TaxID=8400 RepID=UPI003CC9762C
MRNQTTVKDLILSGLSDLPALRLPLFLFFLLIYFLTLIWNLLIIVLIVTDSHLHVPMYFFLGNLASLDLCFSSVTVPRMLFDLHTERRKITMTACITQVFFFVVFGISDSLLLAVMSYDRYTAICKPLHYIQIMSWKVCVLMMSIVWCLGFFSAFIHTFYVLKLTFCASNIIEGFFCDLPQLFLISCSDTFINILLIFLVGGSLAVATLILTFLSYVFIFKTALQMKVKGNRSKVFSTCTSHLTVVSMFYGSAFLNYFQPSGGHHVLGANVAPVFFPVIVPLLNPLIYSLRNQDFRMTFQNVLRKFINTLN